MSIDPFPQIIPKFFIASLPQMGGYANEVILRESGIGSILAALLSPYETGNGKN